jgi:hypothetical protein
MALKSRKEVQTIVTYTFTHEHLLRALKLGPGFKIRVPNGVDKEGRVAYIELSKDTYGSQLQAVNTGFPTSTDIDNPPWEQDEGKQLK